MAFATLVSLYLFVVSVFCFNYEVVLSKLKDGQIVNHLEFFYDIQTQHLQIRKSDLDEDDSKFFYYTIMDSQTPSWELLNHMNNMKTMLRKLPQTNNQLPDVYGEQTFVRFSLKGKKLEPFEWMNAFDAQVEPLSQGDLNVVRNEIGLTSEGIADFSDAVQKLLDIIEDRIGYFVPSRFETPIPDAHVTMEKYLTAPVDTEYEDTSSTY